MHRFVVLIVTAAAAVLIAILLLPAMAMAQVSPFTGHNAATDFCIQCHDVHEAAGDYQLTREATVTETCATCHGLFGEPAPTTAVWGDPPTNFTGAEPTASTLLAYKIGTSGMSAAEIDAVPGHTLGIMDGGAAIRESDAIPGGATLKVMTSGQYGGPTQHLYSGQPATTFNSTRGLYCASCHTAHDTIGQMITGTAGLLSSKPNHISTPATDRETFCVGCHEKRDNVGVERNHPAQFCLNCHGNKAGESDFPHTSSNKKLLQKEPDDLCIGCHAGGTLP